MNGWVWLDLANVRPGDYVLDPNDQPQRVLGRDANGVLLIDQAQATSYAPAAGPVLVWDGPMQQAVEMISSILGGKVLADSSLIR